MPPFHLSEMCASTKSRLYSPLRNRGLNVEVRDEPREPSCRSNLVYPLACTTHAFSREIKFGVLVRIYRVPPDNSPFFGSFNETRNRNSHSSRKTRAGDCGLPCRRGSDHLERWYRSCN